MELAIPLIAFGGLYFMSKNKSTDENFVSGLSDRPSNITGSSEPSTLPNTNVPDVNYPDEVEPYIASQETQITSKLSTANAFDSPSVYTDKYFNSKLNSNAVQSYSPFSNGSSKQNSGNPTYNETPYYSLTGQKVDSSYFKHDNMVPYFAGHIRSRQKDANVNEGILDNYAGAGSQTITKSEISPLFSPGENLQYAHGAPNMNDFYQSRVNPSWRMANVNPFEEKTVAPGLGLGYTTDGSAGYNSGLLARESWLPKTVDELRVNNHAKSSGIGLLGREGPAISTVTYRGEHAPVYKNGQETSFELGPDRLFTTTGVEIAPAARGITIEKFINRPETSQSYAGAARFQSDKTYNTGEYMPSSHMDLGPVPLGVATATGQKEATDGDYEMKSKFAYPNNRTANAENDYYGSVKGALGAVVAPLLDILRPSRKENVIGNLRPYENAHTRVSSSYLFNPADRPLPTIRETTENSKYTYGVNANQRGGAYATTEYQPVHNERDTTTEFFYAGISSASERTKEPRAYDAEYRQRNNDIKSSTIHGRMVPGKMDLLNSDINMRNRNGDQMLKNSRSLQVTDAPKMLYSPNQMGQSSNDKSGLYSTIQMDRNTPDILNAFRQNPYTHSLTNVA